MISWSDRPLEVSYLLNPAFSGLILAGSIQGHEREGDSGFPFPLIFLVLPIVLHDPTRQTMPNRITSSMPAWLQEHPDAMANLPERARSFRHFTQESLRFMLSRRLISLGHNGMIISGPETTPTANRQKRAIGDDEFSAIEAATFLGRWFARSGDVGTIMTLWGVRP